MASSRLRPPSTGIAYTMSARVSPVDGRASTTLSIFTASTRFSEDTGSPVNGERSCAVGEGVTDAVLACPPPRNASSAPVTRPASTTTAAAVVTAALRRVQVIASSRSRRAHRAPCAAVPLSYHFAGYQTYCPSTASLAAGAAAPGSADRPGVHRIALVHEGQVALRHFPQGGLPVQPVAPLEPVHRFGLPGGAGPAGQAALLDHSQHAVGLCMVDLPEPQAFPGQRQQPA